MHTFHTGTVQKVDSVGQTVQCIEYHPADTGLYYQLGTFDTWRSGDVQSGILARVVAAGKLGYGICLGMQCMVIEFARNVLGLEDANSTEMNPHTPENVIDLMEEQKNISNMGGTMRLGAYDCRLRAGSKAAEAYGKEFIRERHRHRFEFNNDYRDRFEAAGMACVGENPDAQLVEVVEVPSKRWYIGTQYHPEYSSTVLSPSPIFASFIEAAIDYHDEKATK